MAPQKCVHPAAILSPLEAEETTGLSPSLAGMPAQVLDEICSKLSAPDAFCARLTHKTIYQAVGRTHHSIFAPAMFRAYAERRISRHRVIPYAYGARQAVCLPTRTAHIPAGYGPSVAPALVGEVLFDEAKRYRALLALGANTITSLDVQHEGLLLHVIGVTPQSLPHLPSLQSLTYSFGAGAGNRSITLPPDCFSFFGPCVRPVIVNRDLLAAPPPNLTEFLLRGSKKQWLGEPNRLPELPQSLRSLNLMGSNFCVGNSALPTLTESRLIHLEHLSIRLGEEGVQTDVDLFSWFCDSIGPELKSLHFCAQAQEELSTKPAYQIIIRRLLRRVPALRKLCLENLPFSLDFLTTSPAQPRVPLIELRALINPPNLVAGSPVRFMGRQRQDGFTAVTVYARRETDSGVAYSQGIPTQLVANAGPDGAVFGFRKYATEITDVGIIDKLAQPSLASVEIFDINFWLISNDCYRHLRERLSSLPGPIFQHVHPLIEAEYFVP